MLRFRRFADAFFEASSGFTSAGLSMVDRPSLLPRTIMFWRSFTQWIGGLGIITFMYNFFTMQKASLQLYYHDRDLAEALPDIELNIRKLGWMYLGFTASCILGLWLAGRPLWEAINHGMTAVVTGGFSITDNSLAGYNWPQRLVVIFFMIIGALHFDVFYKTFRHKTLKYLVKEPQILYFMATLLLLCLLALFELWYFNKNDLLADSLFMMVSALTTTGFSTTTLAGWPVALLMLIIAGMFIGGTSNSTAGGIKTFRFITLLEGTIVAEVLMMFRAGRHFHSDSSGKQMGVQGIRKLYQNVAMFVLTWSLVLVICIYLLLHNVPEVFSLPDVIFESISAISTVGLSAGVTTDDLNITAKIIFSLMMIIGRTELIPLLLISALLFKKNYDISGERES